MGTLAETVAAYQAAFSEPDEARRRQLLEGCFAGDGVFAGPPSGVLEGRAALDAYIGGVQQQMPGIQMVRTTGIDAHNGRLRFRSRVLGPEGDVVVDSVDNVGEIDERGQICRMTVFMGPLPPRGVT